MIEVVQNFGDIKSSPEYQASDFEKFAKEVCPIVGLPTLETILKQNNYNPRHIKEFIHSVAQGKVFYDIRRVTEGQKKFHQLLYKILYEVPLEDLPLYVNDDPDITPVVRWRLKLGK